MQVDPTEVWDSRNHAVWSGGEEDSVVQNDPIDQVCLLLLHIPQHTSVITLKSMRSSRRARVFFFPVGLGWGGGYMFWDRSVKQQHHHLFTDSRSFSRGSGHRRSGSVWKAANHSSLPSRPSSTGPVRGEWRVWSWGCPTGKHRAHTSCVIP